LSVRPRDLQSSTQQQKYPSSSPHVRKHTHRHGFTAPPLVPSIAGRWWSGGIHGGRLERRAGALPSPPWPHLGRPPVLARQIVIGGADVCTRCRTLIISIMAALITYILLLPHPTLPASSPSLTRPPLGKEAKPAARAFSSPPPPSFVHFFNNHGKTCVCRGVEK
jgi:hypothetical protein